MCHHAITMFGPDLAAYHDERAAGVAAAGAATLIAALHAAGIDAGRIADVGCGSGVAAARLIEAGFQVTAIDPSSAMLRLTAKRAPAAQRVRAGIADVSLPSRLVGICAFGEVIGYDPDADLDEVLETFHAALRPSGVLVLDVAGPNRHGAPRVDHFHGGSKAALGMHAIEEGYRLERRITVMTREKDGRYRRRDETHLLRLHPPEDVSAALSRAGFVAVRRLPSYLGAEPFGHGWTGFIASRA